MQQSDWLTPEPIPMAKGRLVQTDSFAPPLWLGNINALFFPPDQSALYPYRVRKTTALKSCTTA